VTYQYLTDEQAEHFLERGFVTLEGCFRPDQVDDWLEKAWVRFGCDPTDRSTWREKRIHLAARESVDSRDVAPAAFGAAADLVGGADRMVLPWRWNDSFIANLGVGDDRPWEPPSPSVGGWHKDGDFFRHFLDSPEQGLLAFVLWTDMRHRGGGTFVAADSVGVVARFLADHPEGVLPDEFDFPALVRECSDFVEMTGHAGDVVLLHPYTLHATSQNVLGVSRIITNPPLALAEPMQFNRADADDFSLVERAVLRGLGVERLDFAPTSPRERVVPQRVRDQEARARAEDERLATTGLTRRE
jgi:Phytanoyl-CoA dioxygenase (PhyH)